MVMLVKRTKYDYNNYSYFVVNTCVIPISESERSIMYRIGILPRNRGMV